MNNRIYKFRAWDNLNKEMKLAWHPRFKVDGYITEVLQDDILMQFSGLKDKNEKEVYEGDIVTDMQGDKRIVEWSSNGFWCSYPNGDHYWPNKDYLEIIGNIYENSNLLKVN